MTVIHSNFGDKDTKLLSGIWEGLDADIIEITEDDVNIDLQNKDDEEMFPTAIFSDAVETALERETDTLIVCGHGDEDGCYAPLCGYTLSWKNRDNIKAKRVIGIWCNAASFAKQYEVPGFFSSMFISNKCESKYMGIFGVDEERIHESERKFTRILNTLIRNNVPMEEWCTVFNDAIDHSNEVEDYNYSMLKYFPAKGKQ